MLYGSQARGGHHEDSDIDVAVVFSGSPPDQYPWDLLHRLTDVAYGVDFSRDFNVHLPPRLIFERQLRETEVTHNPEFYQNILQDGVEWISGEPHAG